MYAVFTGVLISLCVKEAQRSVSVFDEQYSELQKKQDMLHKEDSKLRSEKVRLLNRIGDAYRPRAVCVIYMYVCGIVLYMYIAYEYIVAYIECMSRRRQRRSVQLRWNSV